MQQKISSKLVGRILNDELHLATNIFTGFKKHTQQ